MTWEEQLTPPTRGLWRRVRSFLTYKIFLGRSSDAPFLDANPNLPLRAFMVVASILVIVCGLFAGSQLFERRQALGSDVWSTTQGRVTYSRYFQSPGEREWGSVSFLFQADGQDYRGYRVSFLHDSTSSGDVARYPEGKVVTIHYDADDPVNAVLETGLSASRQVLFWAPASIAALGLLGMLAVIVASLRSWLRGLASNRQGHAR